MKKLLATLLVAVMIMSCMAVVSFAEDITVYLPTDILGEEFFAKDADGAFEGEAIYAYYDAINAMKGMEGNKTAAKNARAAYAESGVDPLYTLSYDTEGDALTSIDVNTETLVPVAFYAENAAVVSGYIEYDEEILAPYYDYKSDYVANFNEKNGGCYFNAKTESDGNITDGGVIVLLCFEVIATSETMGDENGELVTTIKYNPGSEGKVADEDAVEGSFGNTTTTVKLSGLAKGGSTEPEYITADDFTAPVAAVVGGAYADYKADKAAFNFVEGGNQAAMKEDQIYTAIFATAPAGEFAEVGFALSTDGVNFLPHVSKTTKTGEYGMVFYGSESILGNYSAYAYVKYADGTIVYDDVAIALVD